MSDDAPSAADPLGHIAAEFVAAFRQGQSPSVEEFARRYPDHAARPGLLGLRLASRLPSAAEEVNDPGGQEKSPPGL